MPYCGKCGNQITPNAKFCGRCGAPLTQAPPPATEPSPKISSSPAQAAYNPPSDYTAPPAFSTVPPPPPPPPPPAAPTPAPAAPAMPSSVAPAAMPSQPSAPAPQRLPQASGEETYGVILLRRMKSLGRYDSYAGVVTSQRLIFAQITSQMVTDAAQQARDQAKADGKGFFGQWANQLKNTFGFTGRYLTMPPDAILSETPGNFALDNNSINEIKVHLKGGGYEQNQRDEFEAEIRSSMGKYVFRMDKNSGHTDLLKRAYGDRVKMPFGYISKTVNIKF
ncbi:MAG: zinc-ribbon domain-containing protein [Candidatus Bathyarchaeota archaeon]|nr:zinc-ribbon domain-containing protein [Candidatus Bathyarchaeota archaeon]